MISVAIIGAGPAGMSCALWLKNLGLAPCLIDRAGEMGGALRTNFLENDWVLGLGAKTGVQLAETYATHMRAARIPFMPKTELRGVAAAEDGFLLTLGSGRSEQYRRFDALVIAVGTRYRGTEILRSVPGIASLPDDALSIGPHAFADLESCAGLEILVVGAGDNAHEFAMLVAPDARRITLLARSQPRAQKRLRDGLAPLLASGRGEIVETASLVSLEQVGNRVRAVVDSPAGRRTFDVDRIVVQAGYAANSDALLPVFPDDLRRRLHTDSSGYLLAAPDQRTDCFGIYAAGDICNPRFPSVVAAIAAGAVAARSIEMDYRERQ